MLFCKDCGKEYGTGGYFAKVHFQGAEGPWKLLCEDCCILVDSCRCDRCGDEFTESFPMERIDGGWYCEPCSEIEKGGIYFAPPWPLRKIVKCLQNKRETHLWRLKSQTAVILS